MGVYQPGGGWGGYFLYNGLYAYRDAQAHKGAFFFRLEVCKKVGVSRAEVKKRVRKTAILVNVAQMLAKNASFVFSFVVTTCIGDVSQGCKSTRHDSHN